MKMKFHVITVCVIILCAIVTVDAKNATKKTKQITSIADLNIFNEQLVKITNKAIPTVVSISAEKKMGLPRDARKMPMPFPMPREAKAVGSGVIIDKRGYIVTNNHVVKNTKSITVTLFDKRTFPCQLIGSDPATDIAVIKIQGTVPGDIPVAEMADSDTLKVGEIAIAIGNPFGFGHTVTMGIISATGREGFGLADYEYFIQTDAAINPGNSGGPLINRCGEVIGVNVAVSRNAENIGFAIPINVVKNSIENFNKTGKFERAMLGVRYNMISEQAALRNEVPVGAYVAEVVDGSSADGGGIKEGDIITSFNGEKLVNKNLADLVSKTKIGDKVKVKVFRWEESRELELNITMKEAS